MAAQPIAGASTAAEDAPPVATRSAMDDQLNIVTSLQQRQLFVAGELNIVAAAYATRSGLILAINGRELHLYSRAGVTRRKAPLPATLHGSAVTAAHYNARGDHFVLVYLAQEARVCSTDLTMEDDGVIKTGQSSILSSSWLEGRQELVTSGSDGSLRFFAAQISHSVTSAGRKLVCKLVPRLTVRSEWKWMSHLTSDEAEGRLFAASAREVLVWSMASGELLQRLPGLHTNDIRAMAYCTVSRRLLTTAHDGLICKWGLGPSGAIDLDDFEGHTKGVTCLRTLADGRLLVSASEDGTVRVWNVEQAKELHCYQPALAAAKDGRPEVASYASPHPSLLMLAEQPATPPAAGGAAATSAHAPPPPPPPPSFAVLHVVSGALLTSLDLVPPSVRFAQATDKVVRCALIDAARGAPVPAARRHLLITAANNTLQMVSRAAGTAAQGVLAPGRYSRRMLDGGRRVGADRTGPGAR